MGKKNKNIELLKQFGTWIMAGLILAVLFYRIDRNAFFEALNHANLFQYIPLIVTFVFIWFLFESQNLFVLFKYFKQEISYKYVMYIRGSTYLLMLLNYNLGIGGIALYFKKLRDIPLSHASSILIFYLFFDIISLSFMSIIGCLLTTETSNMIDTIFTISLSIFIIYWIGVLLFITMTDTGFLKKIRKVAILKSLNDSTWKTFLVLPIFRGLYFSTFIVFFYFAAKAFHMNIPFVTLAAVVPIILFAESLPLTPSGLGTMQAAMLFFFKPYSTESNIFAFSIMFTVCIIILRIPIGLFFLRKLGRPLQQNEEIIVTG